MLLWKWLPSTLSKLIISSIPPNDLLPVFPETPSRTGLLRICFEDLPSSLTHLNVSFEKPTLIHFYGTSETDSVLESSESEQSRLFPPKLKFMEISTAQMTVEAAKQIPRSVTSLAILRLNSEVCGALPRHLKTLAVGRSIFAPDLIKNMPPSLTYLRLPNISDHETWIDEETGESVVYADLVKRDPEKYGEKTKDPSILWQDDYLFPSTLTSESTWS